MKSGKTISLYWKCQIVCWTVASLYWIYVALSSGPVNYLALVADFLGDISICILISHAYRSFALRRNWHRLTLKPLALRIAIAIPILGALFMVLIAIKLFLVRHYIIQFDVSFSSFFQANKQTLFITGSRLMSIWVLAYHLYHYAQREINEVKKNARLSIISKEAQIDNLTAQLNPHFFFNSLNNIKFLIAEKPDAARRAIDLLSELLRNSLYGKDETLIPIKDEISLIEDYLELEKLRFEERLQTNIVSDISSGHILVPALSIQSLIENAIKHGIDKRIAGGMIEVRIEKLNGHLKISVESPGSLQKQEPLNGLGLKNLRERLRLHYNGNASFHISEISGEKVLATMSIPSA